MPIQINNINVIDDSCNFSAAGVATISSVTINGSTSTVNVGTGITLSGSTGNISIAGTISASGLIVPIQVSSFDPAIGSTSVGVSTNIVINFNQTVGFGTTGFLEIKSTSPTGPLIERLGIGSARTVLDNGGRRLTIDPTNNLLPGQNVHIVMSNGFVVANGNNFTGINTVGTAQTYNFTTTPPTVGDSFGGGIIICQSGGIRWIWSPCSTEVSRSWYCRNDAVTTAQANAACGDWFIPTCGQMQNPVAICKTFWYSIAGQRYYWSNTEKDTTTAWAIRIEQTGALNPAYCFGQNKTFTCLARALRCVTY